jgi:DNA ligase (NAD+)
MKNFLDNASKAYYEGNPIISDAEYDILASHFNYKTVGYDVPYGIEHLNRMYSLKNVFDLQHSPLQLSRCVATPKVDGAAVSCLYVGGKFSLAVTRGDGMRGLDVTEKLSYLVPNRADLEGLVQISGEVIAHKSVPNSRNYASGSLGLKDIEQFACRDLVFAAYEAQNEQLEPLDENFDQAMAILKQQGFVTVLTHDKWLEHEYPTDGTVYRLNNYSDYKKAGWTSHHPRGAFAHKEQAVGVVTKLLDVIWQCGKSGVISPVAILEPIEIEDAIVRRATLHNIEYIENLNLEIGCDVEVIRSGHIIPRVVRRV